MANSKFKSNAPVISSDKSTKEVVEAARALTIKHQGVSEFVTSVISQFDKRGSISEKQVSGLKKVVDRNVRWAAEKAAAPKPTTILLNGIALLMEHAAEQLKFPKVRLEGVTLSVAGPKASFPGAVNVTDGGPFGDNKWYGRIVDGEFRPSRDNTTAVTHLLIAFNEDPSEVAREHGRKFSHCCFCATEITTKESLEVGYGPICADRYGLPWG